MSSHVSMKDSGSGAPVRKSGMVQDAQFAKLDRSTT